MNGVPELATEFDFDEIGRLMELHDIPTRNALARRARLHPQHLYKIFAGKVDPTLSTLDKIFTALGAQPGDILYRKRGPNGDDIEPDDS